MNKESDIYSSFGFMVVGFQQLEHEYSSLLCELIQSPVPGLPTILVSKMSFKNLLGAVSAACQQIKIKEEYLIELEKLIARSLQHEGERNRYLHSHYDLMEVQLDLVRFHRTKHTAEPKKGFRSQSEHFDPSQLLDICYGIYTTIGDIQRLSEQIRMEVFPNRYDYSGDE